jgi:hypothetical protein
MIVAGVLVFKKTFLIWGFYGYVAQVFILLGEIWSALP